MGLFNLFSKSKPQTAASSGSEPRCDHYSFAHVILRDVAFANPTQCVTALASAQVTEFLNELWEQVLAACDEHQRPATIDPQDILIHKIRVGTFPCALVELPTPQFSTEAFFIALVLTVNLVGEQWAFEKRPLRYFTLEYSSAEQGDLKTVVGEWQTTDHYINHGPGPEPDLNEFIRRVTQLAVTGRLADESVT